MPNRTLSRRQNACYNPMSQQGTKTLSVVKWSVDHLCFKRNRCPVSSNSMCNPCAKFWVHLCSIWMQTSFCLSRYSLHNAWRAYATTESSTGLHCTAAHGLYYFTVLILSNWIIIIESNHWIIIDEFCRFRLIQACVDVELDLCWQVQLKLLPALPACEIVEVLVPNQNAKLFKLNLENHRHLTCNMNNITSN